jgi:RNA polymerase sigma factor (sigma-70 family)
MLKRGDHKYLDFYIKDMQRSNLTRITPQQERDLAKIIQTSKNKKAVIEAKEKFLLANLGLVINRAKVFYERFCHKGNIITINDLISEGNLGLLNAIELFNPEKFNTRFSSYAVVAIDKRIIRFYHKFVNTIRIPCNHFKTLNTISSIKAKYNYNVSDEVLIKEAHITKILFNIVKNEDSYRPQNMVDIEALTESLPSSESIRTVLENNQLREYLISKINCLSSHHRDVIFLRYFDEEFSNLKKIARYFGVTRQAIDLRLKRGLFKLRKIVKRDMKKDEFKNIINRR